MRHVDHFWCAMSSIASLRQRFGVPMQASMAEFVLMNEAMSTEVIADGKHLAPELLQFAYKLLTPQRLCLVTDCNRALDMPPGEYLFGDARDGNRFYSDGEVGWTVDRSSLASSVVGMDHMVRHFKNHTSATLPEVIRMASLTPAQRTGIDKVVGSIEPGKRADLLILDDDLVVQQVFAAGRAIQP
jgi:N-acetylglucosamine-6-phosphate deacetylase